MPAFAANFAGIKFRVGPKVRNELDFWQETADETPGMERIAAAMDRALRGKTSIEIEDAEQASMVAGEVRNAANTFEDNEDPRANALRNLEVKIANAFKLKWERFHYRPMSGYGDFGMARRKITSFTHGGQTATVYKDPEWGEFVVRLAGRPQADYHTDDKADAVATAKSMIGLSSTLHGYGKVDVTRNFRRQRKRAPSSCAAGSYRARKSKNGALLTFCCPKGRWDRKRKVCRTGMVLQSLGRPRRRRRR